MQFITTTKGRLRKMMVGLLAGVVFFGSSGTAIAADLNAQIQALKAQVAQQQAQANQLQGIANDYQSRVNQLQAQIGTLQAQIRLSQAQYNRLAANIAENEAKLGKAKEALGANLKSMYISSSETPLEMLMGSDNLSDYFNQQQYHDSIKDKIQSTVATIIDLQEKLKSQQKQVSDLLETQKGQRNQLAVQKAQVDQLLAVAKANVNEANQLVKSTNSELARKQAEQAAALSRQYGNVSSVSACGGGYPYCGAPFPNMMADPWGMYKRQCVSYTAFRVYNSGRYMPYWGGRGNANQWASNARMAGIPVDGSPRVGDVAVSYAGPFGHVMYVESVSGNMITVSQYNYGNDGNYSMMTIPKSGLEFIHF